MNTEMFEHHMGAMKVHFASGSTESFSLPNAVLFSDLQSGLLLNPTLISGLLIKRPDIDFGNSAPNSLEKVSATIKRKMTFFVDDAASSVQIELDKLKENDAPTDADINDFVNAMNKEREAAKKQSEKIIDEAFDSLIGAGKDNPELQSKILRIASSLGPFFTVLLGEVTEFFKKMYENIKDILTNAVEWVKEAGKKVADFAKNTTEAIGGYIGSLF